MPLHFFYIFDPGTVHGPEQRLRITPSVEEYTSSSTPMSCFLLRTKFTAWTYGALQRRRRHFLISGARSAMLEDVIELGESFPTNPKLGVGEPPFWRNLGLNFKIWPQISPPPRGLGGQFWYDTMLDLQGSLSSWIFGEFFSQIFGFFSVKKVQRLIAQNCPSLLRSNFAKWQHGQSCCLR